MHYQPDPEFAAGLRWKLSAEGKVYARDDEPVAVYFDPGSGDTHLIDEHSAFLLDLLQAGPMTLEAMVSNILADASVTVSTAEIEVDVEDLLQELQSFDIVENV